VEKALRESRKLLEELEATIKTALRQRYKGSLSLPNFDTTLQNNVVVQWNTILFFNVYIQSDIYAKERLPRLTEFLIDIKLEFYYLNEIDLAVYSALIYSKGISNKSLALHPHLLLTKLALDQNLLAKTTMLWQKIVRFIYYLEEGIECKGKGAKQKSSLPLLGDFVKKHPQWSFLLSSQEVMTRYANNDQVPKYDKTAPFLKELSQHKMGVEDFIKPVHQTMHHIWKNILSIISGNTVQRFTDAIKD